jgi:hypothetical protein
MLYPEDDQEFSQQDADFNKEMFSKLLNEAGYDAEYLYMFQMPKWWDDKFWAYADYVYDLYPHFVKTCNIHISSKSFDEIFEDYKE